MEIKENRLKMTIHCANDFECLNREINCNCQLTSVLKFIENEVLFVKCTNHWCVYSMHFGNSTICNNPKRKEIFVKYKL